MGPFKKFTCVVGLELKKDPFGSQFESDFRPQWRREVQPHGRHQLRVGCPHTAPAQRPPPRVGTPQGAGAGERGGGPALLRSTGRGAGSRCRLLAEVYFQESGQPGLRDVEHLWAWGRDFDGLRMVPYLSEDLSAGGRKEKTFRRAVGSVGGRLKPASLEVSSS